MIKGIFCITALLLSTAILPANLINQDSKTYQITIKTSGTTHTTINGNTTASGRAPSGAIITIKDTGSTITVGDKDIIIKNGQLKEK